MRTNVRKDNGMFFMITLFASCRTNTDSCNRFDKDNGHFRPFFFISSSSPSPSSLKIMKTHSWFRWKSVQFSTNKEERKMININQIGRKKNTHTHTNRLRQLSFHYLFNRNYFYPYNRMVSIQMMIICEKIAIITSYPSFGTDSIKALVSMIFNLRNFPFTRIMNVTG